MTARLLTLGLCLSAAARAADDHPLKAAKVGDSVTYKLTVKADGQPLTGTTTQTVTARTDKEVTVERTSKLGGGNPPAQTHNVDLTKPYNLAAAYLPPGADVTSEKLKDGKEKVTVGGKEYDAAWATYKVTGELSGGELTAEAKAWAAKGVPFGLIKMELTMAAAGRNVEATLELAEVGNKAKD